MTCVVSATLDRGNPSRRGGRRGPNWESRLARSCGPRPRDRPRGVESCRCSAGYRVRRGRSAWPSFRPSNNPRQWPNCQIVKGFVRLLCVSLCVSWSLQRSRACALFVRVPINAAGSPPFVLPQGQGRPAPSPPRIAGLFGKCVRGSPRGWADRPKRDLDCDSIFGRADPPRFSLHCNRSCGRRWRRSGSCAAHRADEPGRFNHRRRRPG